MRLRVVLTAFTALVLSILPAAASAVLFYAAELSGPAEAPPNASPATGSAFITIDPVLNTMRVQASFSDLIGTTTASHIHCCTAVADTGTVGVATTTPTFTGFPGGVTSGSYDHVYDMTLAGSYNPAFITANGGTVASAFAVLLAGLDADLAYFNIHTNLFPGGEIRGFLHAVPVPGSLALLALGLAAFTLRRRRAFA